MERNRGGRPRHPDVLTPAESRVLETLRDGGTNAEIAARLGISTNTVRYHVSNMLAKLELRDRRALAAWRPDTQRRRLGGVLFAIPAALWSVGRPLAWVGAGVATLAGVLVVVVALVALEGIVEGDGEPPAAVAPAPATTATAMPTLTVAPTAAPTVTTSATATPTWTVAPTATPGISPSPSPALAASPTPTGTPAPRPSPTPAAAPPSPALARHRPTRRASTRSTGARPKTTPRLPTSLPTGC